jgi:pyrimidine-nucleoside phosphorylase
VNPVRLIEAKRDGETLAPDEISAFFAGYLEGVVEEYQMAAFLMAVVLQGLGPDELQALVRSMLHSGAVLNLAELGGPRVDKHSTGGVGDKVSLVLAPLVAEAGVHVPMMSGRGLGHTGGTLDKLEAIPGFRTDLSLKRFRELLGAHRVAMIGQTDEIAPLDRRLYALRSVTGTVASLPLISASIMSKKLAEGLTGLVLDVKVGSGAFLSDETDARTLARTMVEIGEGYGVPTRARLTAMDRPLGRTAGNALEVREALECLRGEGPDDLRRVTVTLAAEMFVLADLDATPEAGVARAEALLDSGAALERFRTMVRAQGGAPEVVDDPGRLPRAPVVREVRVDRGLTLHRLEPRAVGEAVVELGGGRLRLSDAVDPAVGFDELAPPGTRLASGDLLGRVHARNEADARRGEGALRDAVEEEGEALHPLILPD